MTPNTLYHEGELAVQRRAKESGMARMYGGAISDCIPGGAIPFVADQPIAIAGSVARDGRVWASILAGEPGFLRAKNDWTLILDRTRPLAAEDDPLRGNLRGDPRIGLLVIELASRRRLRVNGRLRADDDVYWIIDGGIGITPILCMLRALHADGHSYELHYSARRESDLVFRDTIEALAGERARFYASRDSGGRRIGLDELLGFPTEGVQAYVCGPRRMIIAVREIAEVKGWLSPQSHFESFGASPDSGDREVLITLAKSGKTIRVPASRTILDTLLDAGYAVPHDCKHGECRDAANMAVWTHWAGRSSRNGSTRS